MKILIFIIGLFVGMYIGIFIAVPSSNKCKDCAYRAFALEFFGWYEQKVEEHKGDNNENNNNI